MANVGVTFDFAAESAKLRSEIDKVRKELGTLNATAKGMGDTFALAGKALLGAFSVGTIVSQMKQAASAAISFGDEVQKAAARTGIAAGQFGVLSDAAKMSDVSMEALSKSLQKMQVAISEAGSGSKSQLQAFAALGIEFEQLKRLAPEDQFLKIADRISQMQNQADKVRASVELFGKAGAELLPFFEQGAAGIKKATDEIVRMGGALSDEQIKNLAEADDATKRLSQSWDNFARTLTAKVAPALTFVMDTLTNADKARADSIRASQINALLTSRGPTADLFPDTAALKAELSAIEQRQKLAAARQTELERRSLLGDGRQATRNLPPGFTAPVPAPTAASRVAAPKPADTGVTDSESLANFGRTSLNLNDPLSDPRYLLEESVGAAILELTAQQQAEKTALVSSSNQMMLDSFLQTGEMMMDVEKMKTQTLGQSFQDLVGFAVSQTGAMGKVGKAYAIAQTVWSTGTAIMKAMAEIPFPGNLGVAAMVAAKGAMQLASIRRTNIGSGGTISAGGGSVGTAASMPDTTRGTVASTESQDKSATQIVINGNVFSSQETANWIIEQISSAVNNRDLVFISGNSRQAMELVGA